MKNIRIINLRSLKDTDEIALKKMNILVGNNSSGKSTFLRIFPLLKQTFDKKINGPILWCGDDDDYVDFGSFEEAVNYTAEDKCIKLAFEFDTDLEMNFYRYGHVRKKMIPENVRVEFSIKSSPNTGYEYISVFRYIFREYNIEVCFSEKNEIEILKINDKEIGIEKTQERYYPGFYGLPLFDISLYHVRDYAIKNLRKIFAMDEAEENEQRMLEDYVISIYYSKILKEDIKLSNREKISERLENIYELEGEKEIVQWVLLYNLPRHFEVISNYLRSYFRKVYYIAPVRATAERYYRLRNSAVKEVDCRGKNLPVFLNSLSAKNFLQFQSWTKENLGFEVVKTTSEGHVSLKIRKEGQEKAVNLSDTGFGYSQILPIVTQLWYIAKQVEEEKDLPFRVDDFEVPTTIVIEQPELHLHPGLQAKLVDIMAKVAQQGSVNFIIETHSETMINRMGHVIAKNGMDNDDVGIIIFEKQFDDNNTMVRQGGYDEEGYLENWPIGFFEPEED